MYLLVTGSIILIGLAMKKRTTNINGVLIKSVFAALMLLIIFCHARLLYTNSRDLCDDAMISIRYAANLSYDDGLRYNRAPKGADPVEGYSNFLWVAGISEGLKRQMHPRIITAIMGGICSILCVVSIGVWVFGRTRSFLNGIIAAIVLASYLPFSIWAMQGLETPLFALLVLLSIIFASSKRLSAFSYFFAALACMTRPDGLLAAAYIFIVSWLDTDKKRIMNLVSATFFFLVPFLAYSFWRIKHFNSIIPNVFFAKTGLGIAGIEVGFRYFLTWAIGSGHIFAFFLVLAISAIFYKRTKDYCGNIIIPFGFILIYLTFIVFVGGDFMPDHRFVMHVVPLIIGSGMICIGGYSTKSKTGKRVLFLFALIAITSNILGIHGYFHSSDTRSKQWHQNQAEWYGKTASWLLRNGQRDDVIACGDIGYIGFVTDAERIIDTNGLVDRYLARYPGAASLNSDPDYVISQSPDFIVVIAHYFENGAVIGHNDFDRKFLSDKTLQRGYEQAAELSGWESKEYSFSDGLSRTSLIRFKIFQKIIENN